ncbi:hypothetical protein EDD15DRAFT_2219971, partial [Pisolithus albus]
ISNDLKAHIPVLHHEGYSVKTICHLLGIKKTTVYRVLSRYLCFGSTSNPHTYSCVVFQTGLEENSFVELEVVGVDSNEHHFLDLRINSEKD